VFQGRKTLVNMVRFVFLDVTGKQHPKTMHAHNAVVEDEIEGVGKESGDVTPPEKADEGLKADDDGPTQ